MFIGAIAGNLGQTAETKAVGSTTVTEFSVAHNRRGKDKKDAPPLWIRCSYWGKPGESVSRFLTKGTQVTIAGDVDVREFTKRDGAAGFSVECRVNSLQLMGGKKEGGGTGASTGNNEDTSFDPDDPDF